MYTPRPPASFIAVVAITKSIVDVCIDAEHMPLPGGSSTITAGKIETRDRCRYRAVRVEYRPRICSMDGKNLHSQNEWSAITTVILSDFNDDVVEPLVIDRPIERGISKTR